MFKYIATLVIIFYSVQVLGQSNDTTSYFKSMLKQNYTELDSNFQHNVISNNWKLVSTYNRKILFFRKIDILSHIYTLTFSGSTVCVKYGTNYSNLKSYTVNYIFDDITPDFLLFKLDEGERYFYQILRFEDKYMIVNEYHVNKKGIMKNSHNRLLFEKL